MENNFVLFNFKEILDDIREELENDDDNNTNSTKTVLDAITEDMELEDLPLYKNYLSKFDIDTILHGRKLFIDPGNIVSEADYNLMLRLVAASFLTSYDLNYIKEKDLIELKISVNSETTITKKLQELRSIQLWILFRIYFREQFDLEGIASDKDSMVMETRKEKLILFEKKNRLIRDKIENCQTLTSLDDLLNS